ncbi:MAG: dTDP-4-dehydrorhamnose 3,5-epimerase [Marinilabiliales bacterium]|nr:MAG: dTDP-4-dehydrorhamnose 3,5-epimerase [Marinilabiliales bacterium]
MLEIKTFNIEGPVLLMPRVFCDERGYFMESYQKERFQSNGVNVDFIQDNESRSAKFVMRGLHFQKPPFAQAKLVRVIKGAVFDVAVDIRKSSSTFGKYISAVLSEENKHQLYIPEGFAHGFLSLADDTIVNYKVNAYYNKESEGTLVWNDPQLNIEWPTNEIIISEKDSLVAQFFNNFVSPFD